MECAKQGEKIASLPVDFIPLLWPWDWDLTRSRCPSWHQTPSRMELAWAEGAGVTYVPVMETIPSISGHCAF